MLTTKNLCVSVDGIKLINNLNLTINNYDKIAFIGNEIIITTLFKVLSGEIKPDSGEVIWGIQYYYLIFHIIMIIILKVVKI